MKRFLVLFFFALPLLAQPFTYLGIVDGQAGAFSGIRKDSVFVTGFGSTVSTATKIETLLVNQSFTYMGYTRGNRRGGYIITQHLRPSSWIRFMRLEIPCAGSW
jgi:hypothetical protein